MVVYNNILAGAAGSGGSDYTIERSLRFNDSDSPKLLELLVRETHKDGPGLHG